MSNPKELVGVKVRQVGLGEAAMLGGSKLLVEAGMSRAFGLNSSPLSCILKLGAGGFLNWAGSKVKGAPGTALNVLGNGSFLDGMEDGFVSVKQAMKGKLSFGKNSVESMTI